ncbi:GroES-like protein [Whalleya microplaca]|nr:GroES-like protein [Whalleya microplaca]
MRALRYHGIHDLRVDYDVPEPECGDDQIKVKPAFVGICGTDLHEYNSPTFVPTKEHPHPITKETMPVVLGHEFSGTVLEIGSKVKTELKVGDRVAVQPTISCFECGPCQDGYLNCCDKAGFIGLSGRGGGLSDAVCVGGDFVFKLADSTSLEIGALVEPLAIAWHAVEASQVKPGDDALVIGAGPIGLGVIQCLKAQGANQVFVAEVATERQNFAKHFGATDIFDPRVDDVVAKCKELTGGRGPQVALDCAGLAATVKSACLSVRARGRVINTAICEKELLFQPNNVIFGEKTYSGVLGYQHKDYQGVINAIGKGDMKPEKMITGKISIDRVVEDGFQPLIHDKNNHVKILVDLSK